jgi:hypothetical protein
MIAHAESKAGSKSLYEASDYASVRRRVRSVVRERLMLAALLLGLAIILIVAIIFHPTVGYFYLTASLMAMFGIRVLLDAHRVKQHTRFLRILDNGITLPWRDQRMVRNGVDNFIPFHEIKAVYPNLLTPLDYITIETETLELLDLEKQLIGDVDAYLLKLGGRITIQSDVERIIPQDSRLFKRTFRGNSPDSPITRHPR